LVETPRRADRQKCRGAEDRRAHTESRLVTERFEQQAARRRAGRDRKLDDGDEQAAASLGVAGSVLLGAVTGPCFACVANRSFNRN
jgi:hypothetical protein